MPESVYERDYHYLNVCVRMHVGHFGNMTSMTTSKMAPPSSNAREKNSPQLPVSWMPNVLKLKEMVFYDL